MNSVKLSLVLFTCLILCSCDNQSLRFNSLDREHYTYNGEAFELNHPWELPVESDLVFSVYEESLLRLFLERIVSAQMSFEYTLVEEDEKKVRITRMDPVRKREVYDKKITKKGESAIMQMGFDFEAGGKNYLGKIIYKKVTHIKTKNVQVKVNDGNFEFEKEEVGPTEYDLEYLFSRSFSDKVVLKIISQEDSGLSFEIPGTRSNDSIHYDFPPPPVFNYD